MSDDKQKTNRPVGGEHHSLFEDVVDETRRGRHVGPDLDAANREKELREIEEKR